MIRTLKKLLFDYFTFPPNANTKWMGYIFIDWNVCIACTCMLFLKTLLRLHRVILVKLGI